MKKFVSLKCTICARTRDSLIDTKHYTTDKCTITLGCEGRLFPTGYTSDGTTVLSVPPTGLTNWYPRGSTTTATVAVANDTLYNTSTGSKQQFILAVSDTAIGFTPSASATITLNLLAEQQVARSYRQYTYRETTAFTTVNGVEDGVGKKVLRYSIVGSTPDQVEVYLNGVKKARGTGADQFQLYDGTATSAAAPNSVLFNTAVTGVANQVDVIVTQAATISSATLSLLRVSDDDSRVGLGAWEGVDAVKSLVTGRRYSLFYCDFTDVGVLPSDAQLRMDTGTPSQITDGGTHTLLPTSAFILLTRTDAFTTLDRLRAVWIPLSKLVDDTDYLLVQTNNGQRQLLITESSTVSVFPPLDVVTYQPKKLLKTTDTLTGNPDSVEVENTLIVGPDA